MEGAPIFTCLICLSNENLLSIADVGTENIDLKTKLKFCLPELDWNITCSMCKTCAEELNVLCRFRNKCLSSYLCKRDVSEDKVQVRCRLCLEVFDFRNDLTEHNLREHYVQTPHDCLLCFNSYNTQPELVEHENTHYLLQKYYCDDCKTSYSSTDELSSHITFKHCKSEDWNNPCPHCGVMFPTKDSLDGHIVIIHGDRVSFACFHCGLKYEDKTMLVEHIKETHVVKKEYMCLSCNSVHSTKKKLEIHRSSCGVQDEYCEPDVSDSDEVKKKRGRKPKEKVLNECDICGVNFSARYLLTRHVRNVHATEKIHGCDECGQKFASAVYLAAHKKYHSGSRPHICSFCGKGYITTSDLYHHEKIHANKRAYKCDKCPKAFNTSSDLHKHRICVHVDRSLWKYVCTYCERRFPLKTNLDTHIKTHTGERNYACHLCDRRCINQSVLQRHIDSHSNICSFTCSQCGQDYKHKKSLNIHLAKVHGIGDVKIPEPVKKFFCPFCPRAYFANNKLQKHIRTHTGERPFSCNICAKSFIDKSYVKQHMKTAHNIVD